MRVILYNGAIKGKIAAKVVIAKTLLSTCYIGRDPDSDLHCREESVSMRHATIVIAEGKAVLSDSDSTNGTFLNGERITGPRELKSDDVIEIGERVFTALLIEDAESEEVITSGEE